MDAHLAALQVVLPLFASPICALIPHRGSVHALTCAVTAMAVAFPETGLITHEIPGGEIRPVGKRSLVILGGLP